MSFIPVAIIVVCSGNTALEAMLIGTGDFNHPSPNEILEWHAD